MTRARRTRWIGREWQPRYQVPLSTGKTEPWEPVARVNNTGTLEQEPGAAIVRARILRLTSALASQGRNKDTFLDVPCSKCLGSSCNVCHGRDDTV